MQFFTNGKIIVSLEGDMTALSELNELIVEAASETMAMELNLSLEEENPEAEIPMNHIVIQDKIEFNDLRKLMPPYAKLEFRAIGTDRVQLPEKYVKDFERMLTEEELDSAGRTVGEQLKLQAEIESEKKKVMGAFKTKLEEVQAEINRNGALLRERKVVDTKHAFLHLDFINGIRVYTDEKTGDVLLEEPLKPEDKQKLIFPELGESPNGSDDFGEVQAPFGEVEQEVIPEEAITPDTKEEAAQVPE